MEFVDAVGWASLAAGVGCLLVALLLGIATSDDRKATKEAAQTVAEKTKEAAGDQEGKFQEQAGSLSTTLDSVAALATALKDLDRVAQLLSVALGFFGIAGVVAGLEQVAQSLGP